jgi:3-oxoacyl-[acyl-carrier protein] reductase
MDLELAGKRALVTGGSKGIGYGIARRLLAEGCKVKLVARDAAALDKARAALVEGQRGAEVTAHAADLGDRAHLARIFPLLAEVDILVNSAGAVPRGKLLDTSADVFRAAFDVKVMGTIDLCREAYRHMSARRSGVIVNIIGLSGERPNPKSVPTSTANAALIAFTQAVGCMSADDNVRVVGINPGLIATPRTAGMTDPGNTVDNTAYNHLLASLPFGRMGKPEEIADMVAFLASARASYVSGSVFTVDGGARFRA